MMQSRANRAACRNRTGGSALLLALFLAGPVPATDHGVPLTGLFCNTEDQLGRAMSAMAQGLTAQAAAETVNGQRVHCTAIDRLHYLVADLVRLPGGHAGAMRFRGMLVGVIAGDALRPVSPPSEVYFITPEMLADAALERSG